MGYFDGDINTILNSGTELKRVFRWVLTFPTVDGSGLASWHAKTANRPKGSFEEIVIDSLGGKKYVGGKFAWETIDLTLYDPLEASATVELINWFKLNYNPADGSMGYENNETAGGYKQNVTLSMVTPDGNDGEKWDLTGCWPMSFDLGALDYAGNDAVEISFTLRYDNATLAQASPSTEGG
tara:strand:+ start:679 stop:1224 length:546 start_codon:yes stop_codon:yes gene_type:complete